MPGSNFSTVPNFTVTLDKKLCALAYLAQVFSPQTPIPCFLLKKTLHYTLSTFSPHKKTFKLLEGGFSVSYFFLKYKYMNPSFLIRICHLVKLPYPTLFPWPALPKLANLMKLLGTLPKLTPGLSLLPPHCLLMKLSYQHVWFARCTLGYIFICGYDHHS